MNEDSESEAAEEGSKSDYEDKVERLLRDNQAVEKRPDIDCED